MKKILLLAVLLIVFRFISEANITLIEKDGNFDSKNDTLMLNFKITNTLEIGWGTVYKVTHLEQIRGKMPNLNDSIMITIAVGNNLEIELEEHAFKINKFYTASFLNSGKKTNKSYIPSGISGFVAKNGEIWLMISINETNMENKMITVTGKAYDAKTGAILITDNKTTYYIEGLDEWPSDFSGKIVKVTGILKREFFDEKNLKNEKGEYIQGMSGEKLSLQNAKWNLQD